MARFSAQIGRKLEKRRWRCKNQKGLNSKSTINNIIWVGIPSLPLPPLVVS
eukprot:m.9012 g.9012  ORF g.9012 m.9012 type:complete len:51 (-) comp3337_c0_seq1:563-715(-)